MKIHSEQEMLEFGESFAKKINSTSSSVVIELIGDVGVGKTTFVRGLAKGLKVKEPVTSPSFTISKVYALKNGENLVHYDFYRLENPGIMAEDLAENLENPKNIVVIEWGETITDVLPKDRMVVSIKYNDDNTRTIKNETLS